MWIEIPIGIETVLKCITHDSIPNESTDGFSFSSLHLIQKAIFMCHDGCEARAVNLIASRNKSMVIPHKDSSSYLLERKRAREKTNTHGKISIQAQDIKERCRMRNAVQLLHTHSHIYRDTESKKKNTIFISQCISYRFWHVVKVLISAHIYSNVSIVFVCVNVLNVLKIER